MAIHLNNIRACVRVRIGVFSGKVLLFDIFFHGKVWNVKKNVYLCNRL